MAWRSELLGIGRNWSDGTTPAASQPKVTACVGRNLVFSRESTVFAFKFIFGVFTWIDLEWLGLAWIVPQHGRNDSRKRDRQ
jgi:hypothetical protein